MPSKEDQFPPNDAGFLKLYLDTEFKNINKSLTRIEEQTKTNEGTIQGVIRTMNQMQLVETLHFTDCPNTKEIENVKGTLSEFLFFKKYYKTFLISGLFMTSVVVVGGLKTWDEFVSLRKQNTTLNTELQETKKNVLLNEGKTQENTNKIYKNKSESYQQQNTKK